MMIAPPLSSFSYGRRDGLALLVLAACLCLATAATETAEVDPIGFLHFHNKQHVQRSLQATGAPGASSAAPGASSAAPGAGTSAAPLAAETAPPTEEVLAEEVVEEEVFRKDCLYDVSVYMDIRGGSVNQYDQILFGGPSTPGGSLTIGNNQVASGGSPSTFNLLDGGTTGWLQIEYNTQSCGSQIIDLTASIDTNEFGPHKRIVCGGGLFTLFLKLRVFLQNPTCLLEYSTGGVKKQPLTIAALPIPPPGGAPAPAGGEEACIFQVSKYTDYTFENTASFKTPALNEEFVKSPQTKCYSRTTTVTSSLGTETIRNYTECDTFQLYEYDDGQGNMKYLATVTSNHTTQCVANHELMAPVAVTERIIPGAKNDFETSSFRQLTFCDGTEGYVNSNEGAAYFWWMTVNVLNPKTCTTLASATAGPSLMEPPTAASASGVPDTGGEVDAGTTAAPGAAAAATTPTTATTATTTTKGGNNRLLLSTPTPTTVTLWDLDQFILQATTKSATSTTDNNHNDKTGPTTTAASTTTTTTTSSSQQQESTTYINNNKSSGNNKIHLLPSLLLALMGAAVAVAAVL